MEYIPLSQHIIKHIAVEMYRKGLLDMLDDSIEWRLQKVLEKFPVFERVESKK